ncbi:MAG: type IV pilus assembly protein PilM [Candidatus Pacebacteria bacterium]|nr:type IV pilus assembly protein PilM [Candidatus Paceibacterota bacterium]
MAFSLSSLFTKSSARGTRSVVGIDIGSSSIKLVQLHDKKGVPTLDTYGELQLGPYGGVEIGRVTQLDQKKLIEAVVDILRESSVTTKNAAVAVSYSASFATVVDLDTIDQGEIQNRVPVEARKYIPVPLSEVTLDWFPIAVDQANTKTKVMMAAIHNTALDKYTAVTQSASLQTVLTELEIFSAVRSSAAQSDGTVAVLDMGAGATKLFIAKQGVVHKTHSVRMGGLEITKNIAEASSLSFKDAEALKRTFSLQDGDEKTRKVITKVLERGFQEIHKVITKYEQTENTEVERVVLSGSGAMLVGMQTYAQDILQHKVAYSDSFSKVAYPAFLEDTLVEAGPVFATAIGVALQALLSE